MRTADFFCPRIDATIKLKDPLAVLATRLPLGSDRSIDGGQTLEGHGVFRPTQVLLFAGFSNAGTSWRSA